MLVLVRLLVAVQMVDWKDMTYNVLMETLNPTRSLTNSNTVQRHWSPYLHQCYTSSNCQIGVYTTLLVVITEYITHFCFHYLLTLEAIKSSKHTIASKASLSIVL